MPVTLITTSLIYALILSCCQTSVIPTLDLTMQTSSVRVLFDYTQESITYLADQLDKEHINKPVGFFAADLKYSAVVDEVTNPNPSCAPAYRLKLTLSLDNRIIQVANNLPSPNCSVAAVIHHYNRILGVDESAVKDEARHLFAELSLKLRMEFKYYDGPLTSSQYSEKAINLSKSVIGENSAKMLAARSQARAAARDDDDVQAAVQACGKSI